jgi:hypothetical protein
MKNSILRIVIAALMLLMVVPLSAQDISGGEHTFDQAVNDLETFEEGVSWVASSNRTGLSVSTRLVNGTPRDLQDQSTVLGVKLETLKPGEYTVRIRPRVPIEIGRGCVNLSVYAQGNNTDHVLLAVIKNKKTGQSFNIAVDKLNFIGWKKMAAYIDVVYKQMDLVFDGFLIVCDPMDMNGGSQYLYFDMVSVTVPGER